ncbi:MAG: SCO family protein [Terriglobia bacterium]
MIETRARLSGAPGHEIEVPRGLREHRQKPGRWIAPVLLPAGWPEIVWPAIFWLAAVWLVPVWLVMGWMCVATPAIAQSGAESVFPGAASPNMVGNGPLNSKQTPALLRGVGIDQRLNQQVPLDLAFHDASGKQVRLGDYFGQKPMVLSLVYFNCPNLCTMVEDNLVQTLRLLNFTVGKQFNVLTVSFDPHDTPEMAADKRAIYLGMYGRDGSQNGWHFLTGSEASIKALTDAVGFHYNYDPTTHSYAHAAGVLVLTPQGKVSKYFYGLVYPTKSMRLALVQASDNRIGSAVDELILYCCQYDPATGKYDWVINRVLTLGAIVWVLCLGTLILVLLRGERHRHMPA